MSDLNTKPQPGWLRPTIDYGPLLVFLAAYFLADLYVATGAIVVATVAALALSLIYTRKLPTLPLVTGLLVVVFGGLTLWLDDPMFIKMKPTIVQVLMASVLLGGLAVGRPLLRPVLGMAMPWPMSERGWSLLTLRWALFFLAMAALNELVWRTQSTDLWVAFKVFGIMALTVVFAMAQLPLIQRYRSGEAE